MKFKYDFIPQGSKIEIDEINKIFKTTYFSFPEKKNVEKKWPMHEVVVLDTGNKLQPGIIDHHQPNSEVENLCVTSLVVIDHEKYLSHLKNCSEVTIVTHFTPDLDALGAVYFTQKYLSGKKITEQDKVIADYILEVDSGKLSIDPENPVGIASIWLAITASEIYNPKLTDEQIINKGFELLDNVQNTLINIPSPWSNEFGPNIKGFEIEKTNIYTDSETYQIDFKERSKCYSIELYNNILGGEDEVDVIFTQDAKSFLWKYWVRGDKKNSFHKQGFILTCNHLVNKRRSIISVDPNTPYNLKGLGILIDRIEIDNLLNNLSIEQLEEGINLPEGSKPGKRDGFHRNDPWYDGRGFHKYTIIDAPRVGTNLSTEKIEQLILSTEVWKIYGNITDEKLKTITINELLSLPIPNNDKDEPLHEIQLPDEFNYQQIEPSYQHEILKCFEKARFKTKYTRLENVFYRKVAEQYLIKLTSTLNTLETENFTSLKEEICNLIYTYMDAKSIKFFLLNSINIPVTSFNKLINYINNITPHNELFYFLSSLQNKHPKPFYLFNNNPEQHEILDLLRQFNCNDDEMYDIPLYSYNKLKNYFDDILVNISFIDSSFKEKISNFIKTDFTSNFTENGNDRLEMTETHNEFLSLKISSNKLIFGDNLEKIRDARNHAINHLKGLTVKKIKQYSPEELIELNYNEISNFVKLIESEKNNQIKDYLNIIRYLQTISAIDLLQKRLVNFSCLLKLNESNTISTKPFLIELNELIYKLFYAQSIYIQSSNSEDADELFSSCIEKINIIRTLQDTNSDINVFEFNELLSQFILNIISEINMPLDSVEDSLKSATEQYNILCNPSGLLKMNGEVFPNYYSFSIREILIGFKRYYSEKIHFLREKILRLTELADSPEEIKSAQAFDELYINLINETIKFDWQEIKDKVDNGSGDTSIFYKKYFHWHSLNFKTENKANIAELNSKIRFSLGVKNQSLNNLVEKLPDVKHEISFPDLLQKITLGKDFKDIITHLPNKFIHLSFDYISKIYIDKFDIDTAQKGLYSYSTNYPWYYKLFTRTYFLRLISLLMIAMLLLAGIFDGSNYSVDETLKHAPIADKIKSLTGEHVFYFFNHLFSYFWIIILSLSFTLPIIALVIVIKNYYSKSKINSSSENESNNKLKFLDLINQVESKKSNLLYLSFIIPLLFVVLQMANAETIGMINNITGIRFISSLIIIIGLTISAVYGHVKDKNKHKSNSWILKRTEHMFWLYFFQAILISIFIIDIMLRLEINISDFSSSNDLFIFGISKFIRLEFGYFDFIIMPIFTILVSLLTLFFSFFIDKVLGNKNE